jgi:Outer membrane protein beta-barrel domain
MTNRIQWALAGAALALAAAGVQAQGQPQGGGYGGVAFGATSADVDCTGTLSCDKNDTGYKLYAGYRWASGFGVEGLAYDMGTFSGAVSLPGFGVVNADFKTTGFGIAASFTAPLGPSAELLGRLGVGSNKMKVSVAGGGVAGSDSESSAQLLWGLGVGYKISPSTSIRAEVDGTAAEYGGETFRSMLFSLGLSFRF